MGGAYIVFDGRNLFSVSCDELTSCLMVWFPLPVTGYSDFPALTLVTVEADAKILDNDLEVGKPTMPLKAGAPLANA